MLTFCPKIDQDMIVNFYMTFRNAVDVKQAGAVVALIRLYIFTPLVFIMKFTNSITTHIKFTIILINTVGHNIK